MVPGIAARYREELCSSVLQSYTVCAPGPAASEVNNCNIRTELFLQKAHQDKKSVLHIPVVNLCGMAHILFSVFLDKLVSALYVYEHLHTCNSDISRRSAITRAAMQSLENQIWRSRLAISTKLKLYNTCILTNIPVWFGLLGDV